MGIMSLGKGVMLLKGAQQVLAPQQGWPWGVPKPNPHLGLRFDAAAANLRGGKKMTIST